MTAPSGPPTNFDSLQVAGVPTMGTAGLPLPGYNGNYWFVNSVSGSDGNVGNVFNNPFATTKQALAKAVAGDVIVWQEGHVETISTAGGVAWSTAGIQGIGLGEGGNRPTFTFSATASTWLITGASTIISNILATNSIDQVVSPFVVQGADVVLGTPSSPIEWQDNASNKEALRAILTSAAATRFATNLIYRGQTGGSHCVNAVRLVGVVGANINVDFYGKASTAIVEFVTTACANVLVTGYFYNSGTTNFSKNVVDTATGSTWYANGWDGAAGLEFDGGSGNAIGGNDVATVIANQAVPAANNTANLLERDVIGNMTDTGITAVGANKTLMAYQKGLVTMNTVQAQDATNDAFAGDVIGNKTDSVLTAVGTTKSIAAYVKTALQNIGFLADAAVYNPGSASGQAYLKGVSDLQENVSVTAAATLTLTATPGVALFTIAGGPIEILGLFMVVVTSAQAVATTVQYQNNATLGATAWQLSGASSTMSGIAAGSVISLEPTALSTAPTIFLAGGSTGVSMTTTLRVLAFPGNIAVIVGGSSNTGTFQHYLRYRPLTKGVTVTNAF